MKKRLLAFLLLCVVVTCVEAQVTEPCTPFPCSSPYPEQFDPTEHVFDTTHVTLGSHVIFNEDTMSVKCGWIYKFKVVAGAVYEWNTKISHNVVPTVGNNKLRTKITLFYDDYTTPAVVSDYAVDANDVPGCAAAGLAWRANYTGNVGIMVTRGDIGVDSVGDFCACNEDSLYLKFNQLEFPSSNYFIIWGRYGAIDTLPCDDAIHLIYESGSNSVGTNGASGNYSDNENGYLVLHPGDVRSKLKLWGDSKLQDGDTLFIYNGDLSQNPNIIPYDTIVGLQHLGDELSPIFLSQVAGQPITLRMQSDSSCSLTGLEIQAKCCLNPGLPTDLEGHMTSDTTALLTWQPAEGNEIQYNWSLYTVDSNLVASGNIRDTTWKVVPDLNPNECYFFTISVQSVCSMEGATGDDGMDVVYSNTFCYPYFVTLSDHSASFDFNTDTLYVPEGAHVDSSGQAKVIIHESVRHVCYGSTAQICYNFPNNVKLVRQMTWSSSYQLDSVVPRPIDTSYTLGDTNVYISYTDTNDVSDCFYTSPLYEDGFVVLDVWTEGMSLTRAILHIIVDSLPVVYITVNNEDASEYTSCENAVVQLVPHGANSYNWTDSLNLLSEQQQHSSTLTIVPNRNNAYYVEGTNFFGCKARDTIRSHINPLPDLQYNGNDTICQGDSIWLHVDGIENYTWKRVDTLRWDTTYVHYTTISKQKTQLINDMRSYFPLDNRYLVFCTSQCGSSQGDTIVILRSQLNDTHLLDSLLNTTARYRFGYLATDYHKDPSYHTIAQGSSDSIAVAPRITTDYLVFGTDTNGCFCRDTAVIHIKVLPHPTILATHSTGVVCAHDTVTLSATVLRDGFYLYQWTKEGDNTVLGTDTVLRFVPDSSTTLYFSAIQIGGCDTTVAFPIVLYPQPEITLQAFPDTVCHSQTSTLTISGSELQEWYWDDGTSSRERVVRPESDTVYSVTGVDSYGCPVTASVPLYMYPMPTQEPIVNDSICLGMWDTIVLSGTAVHYQWLDEGVQHNVYGDSLFVAPTVNTTYSVAYDNAYGCWDTTQVHVYVYAFPEPRITRDTTICRGDSVRLTASGGAFFRWDDAAHSTTSSITVSPVDTMSYHVMVYDFQECYATGSVTVNVIPYFDLSITASADSVCPNSVVVFTANGGDDYIWNNDPSETSSTFTLQADTTTVVMLNAANFTTNCSRTVFDTLVVHPLPEFHFETVRDTLCVGESLTINLVGDAAYYVWSSGDTATSLVITPEETTTYMVTAYSAYQCQTVHDYTVVVNPLPSEFSIIVGDHLCFGDSLPVYVSPELSGVRYLWNYPNIPDDAYWFYYTPQRDIVQDYTDTLSLTIVDANGCQRENQALITVYALPHDAIIGPSHVCRGDTVWLYTSGQYHYTWDSSIEMDQSENDTVWDVPSSDMSYSVMVENDHLCHVVLTKDILFKELPVVSISADGRTKFCNNEYYRLTASGAEIYYWDDGQMGASILVQPMNQTTYSVTGVDAFGCEGERVIPLDVYEAPPLTLDLQSDTICALDTFRICAQGLFTHILWNTQDTTYCIERSDLVTSSYFSATIFKDYDGIQCHTTDSVLVHVYPVPQLNVVSNTSPICGNETGVIVVSGADSYEWISHEHLYAQEGPMAIIRPEHSTERYIDTFLVWGYLNGFNCRSVLAVPFIVDSLPDAHIDLLASGTSVCLNDTVTLVARGGVSHFWYLADNPQQVIATGRSLTVSPEVTTTYMLRVISANNCVDTAYYTVNINGHPDLSVSVSDAAVCYGFPAQLSATSSVTLFSWSHASTLDDASSSTPVAMPLETTTYWVTVTDALTGCETTDSVTIVVHPSPVVSSDAPHAACAGETFTITLAGADQYMWFTDDLETPFHEESTLTTPPQEVPETYYRVIGVDQYGCRDTLPITVNVYPLPEISAQVSSPGFLCNDGKQFLGITVVSDIDGTLYQWSSYPYDPSMSYDQNLAFVSPDTTTMYMIDGYYVIDGVVCHAYDTANVVVYPTPEVIASIYPEIPCDHIEVTLTATGASQYMWFLGNQLVATGSEISVMSEEGARYIVAGTDSNRCISRDTIEINAVHEPPVDTIIGATSVCYNVPTVLKTSGLNHCEWYPAEAVSNVTDSSVTVTITENTTFTVYVINEFGCRDTMYYPMTVMPLPVLVLPNDTVLCEDDAFTFRVSGATYYVWEDGSTNDFRTVYPSLNTTSYRVTGTNQYGCQTSDSISVTIYPAFDLHIVASRDTFCIEDNAVTLTAYGAGDNYLWNTGSRDSIITVYPTSTTTYSLTAFNISSGCLSSISREIVRMENPSGQITSSQPFLCLHDTAELSVSLAAGESVVWNTNATESTIMVSPQDTTTYSAVVTNDFGCTTLTSYRVDVLPIPQVSILLSDSVLCYGNVVTLTAIGDADMYHWSTGEVGNSITITHVSDENFHVTGYYSSLCHRSDTAHVTIRPLPSGLITGPSGYMCQGDSAVLNLSSTNVDCVWLPAEDVVQTNGTTAVVKPDVTKPFTAVMTNEYGCVDSTHVTVYVFEPLPLQITADTVLCYGSGVDITVAGSWNYLWNDGFQGNSQYVTPTQTTTYTVSSIDLNNCVTTISTTITVQPDYSLSLYHSKDTICVGDSVTLWYIGALDQHHWSTGSTADSITVSPMNDAIYSIWAYNQSTNCAKNVFDTIVVLQYPAFMLSTVNLVCAGDTLAVRAFSDYAFDYTWRSSPEGSVISQPDSAVIWVSPQVTTAYIYQATNHFCTLTDSVIVEVAPQPVITVDEILNETCLQNNGSVSVIALSEYPPLNYYWSTGAQGASVIQNLSAGLYSLTVTDALGCSNSLSDIEIVNIPPPEVDVITALGSINGGDGSIDIDVPNYYGNYTVSWYLNSLDNYLPMYEGLTSINGLDSGYYYVVVTDGACSVTEQVFLPHDYFGRGNIYYPNTITPSNEDGINDYFQLYYVGTDIREIEVFIFNRWGSIVFQSCDPHFKWKGEIRDRSCDASSEGKIYHQNVYNVIIRYRDARGTKHEIVTLLVVL